MIWRPEVVPPVTQELKGRKQNHFGFWNISSRPSSVDSFIEIGQPKFPTSGTLSQTMTLKTFISHAVVQVKGSINYQARLFEDPSTRRKHL